MYRIELWSTDKTDGPTSKFRSIAAFDITEERTREQCITALLNPHYLSKTIGRYEIREITSVILLTGIIK